MKISDAVTTVGIVAYVITPGLDEPKYTGQCERGSLIPCRPPIEDPVRRDLYSSTLAQNGIAGDLSTESKRESVYLAVATSSGTGRIQMGAVFVLTST